jgi:hypothetical protein
MRRRCDSADAAAGVVAWEMAPLCVGAYVAFSFAAQVCSFGRHLDRVSAALSPSNGPEQAERR